MEAYLDYNATSPLDLEVFDAMKPLLLKEWANASSFHQRGQAARHAVEEAEGQDVGKCATTDMEEQIDEMKAKRLRWVRHPTQKIAEGNQGPVEMAELVRAFAYIPKVAKKNAGRRPDATLDLVVFYDQGMVVPGEFKRKGGRPSYRREDKRDKSESKGLFAGRHFRG